MLKSRRSSVNTHPTGQFLGNQQNKYLYYITKMNSRDIMRNAELITNMLID